MSEPEVIEERGGVTIVREDVAGYERYHVENPLDRMKSFDSLDRARLYADVYTLVGGFREEKTGERGAPPTIAQARQDIQMAYYASTPSMSVEWVARFFDVDEDEVRANLQLVKSKAKQIREEEDEE